MKVTIVGAGNVGATCADALPIKELLVKLFYWILKKVLPRESIRHDSNIFFTWVQY